MKWIKILIDIALVFIPGLALKGKKNIETELEIANKTIKLMSNRMTPEGKGHFIEQAIGNLKGVQNFKKRVSKKIDKAKKRLYKKLF